MYQSTSYSFWWIENHSNVCNVKPPFNEPLYNEFLDITNYVCMEQNLDVTNQFPYSLGTSLNQGSTVQQSSQRTYTANSPFTVLSAFHKYFGFLP